MVKNVVIVLLVICIVIQFAIYKNKERKREKQIEELIQYLMLVQDRLKLPEMKLMEEGQLHILQSEIYKVVSLLQEAYSSESEQKRYMADMMSDISHQIKTPIAAITIMADLLEASECSEEQRLEYADKIDKQAKRITWLIRNLLSLAQLEADVLELKREQVDCDELLRVVCEAIEIMAEVKGVEIICESERSFSLACDRHWMSEAIINVAKNCIEHTDSGGRVCISASQDNIATHIRITDTGHGISEEHLSHIFERFYKGDNQSSNSIGIGLAMAKQIILKQNGTISVTSTEGVGTEFYIKLFRTETV